MSQEFSLLHHLGVSVPDTSSTVAPSAVKYEGRCRVITPRRRPPVKGNATSEEFITPRRVPAAPLAEFTGEVVTVRGKNTHADTEYIIYNARVPSIRAVNMQMMEEKKKQRAKEVLTEMSPYTSLIQPRESDNVARRRLLENLQKTNFEQAQRRMEEKERERQRRLEREAAYVKAIAEEYAKEEAAIIEKKKIERESLQQAALEAINRKKQQSSDSNNHDGINMTIFPWDDESRKETNKRAQCLSLMEANRKLAEQAKKDRQLREKEEKLKEEAVLSEIQANIELENARTREKKRLLCESQRSNSFIKNNKVVSPSKSDNYDSSIDWFSPSKSIDDQTRRERDRKVMKINKQLAEETKRKREKDELMRVESERKMIQEAEQLYQNKRRHELNEKHKQQEELFKASIEATKQREAIRQRKQQEDNNIDSDDFFLLLSDNSKVLKERQKKAQIYYNDLRKNIDSAREARVEEREREVARERRLIQEAESEAKRKIERQREKEVQKREGYRKALEYQIKSRKPKVNRGFPVPHRGPETKVLYRCPVTGELLPPEQFGVSLNHFQTLGSFL